MRLLLISSSNVYGYGYLDHAEPYLRDYLGSACKRIAFVPFAAFDHAAYTDKVRERFGRMDIDVVGLDRIDHADAIFVGGGNTFRLLKTLYEREMLEGIRTRVRNGMTYVGSSAGSILTCPTIMTTNDMPIVRPPSFDALGLIPFQLNCHYIDADPNSTHMGETREVRIAEYHEENDTTVLGLREGSMLRVENGVTRLLGERRARIFRRGEESFEIEPNSVVDEFVR